MHCCYLGSARAPLLPRLSYTSMGMNVSTALGFAIAITVVCLPPNPPHPPLAHTDRRCEQSDGIHLSSPQCKLDRATKRRVSCTRCRPNHHHVSSLLACIFQGEIPSLPPPPPLLSPQFPLSSLSPFMLTFGLSPPPSFALLLDCRPRMHTTAGAGRYGRPPAEKKVASVTVTGAVIVTCSSDNATVRDVCCGACP
jgi:hypothetical protein